MAINPFTAPGGAVLSYGGFASPLVNMNELITSREIQALVGLGRSATHNLTRQPGFPNPYRINARTLRWDRSEVMAWLEERKNSPTKKARARQSRGRRFSVDGVSFRTVA